MPLPRKTSNIARPTKNTRKREVEEAQVDGAHDAAAQEVE
jgi:hypothetical protein